MSIKLPDWLRAFAALGKFGDDYKVLATDVDGQLYILLVGGTIDTIAGDVSVVQDDSTRQVEGTDGANYHVLSVDANGQLIMIPRGATGNYMDVDANGFMTTVIKGLETGVGLHTIEVDASGQMIMIPRGESGHYMAVDTDGNLSSVMYGWTGAALKKLLTDDDGYLIALMKGEGATGLATVKLDDEGRMYAYISDETDQWGNAIPTGLTEVAARLGSPVAYERRGQVIVLETFDYGVKDWRWSTETASSYIKSAVSSVVHGGYSAYLFRAAASGGYNQLGRRLVIGPTTTIGLSVWFRMYGTPFKIRFNILADDGVNTHEGGLMIYTANDLIYYKDSSGVDQLITTYPCYPPSEKQWHFIKFTMNLATDVYGYAIINGTEHDLSANALETGITSLRQVLATVEIRAETTHDAEVFVDSLTITTME